MEKDWINEWDIALRLTPKEIMDDYPVKMCFEERQIYSIVFDDNSVYVGVSIEPYRRLKGHLSFSCNPGVRKRIKTIPYKFLLGARLKCKKDMEQEEYMIQRYKTAGFLVLNVREGGKGNFHDKVKF